ncbi:MAG: hypothetical protein A3E01_05335 [Gammaproteobacteria bacterium RIFCSPHIGHO2_12_FULL_63_22]|nr:MAG: hypothetical protein A3E01_05335 [Gammaproteobacteria bacterium RIFCSPHIGHO2_12_FULL_63_22]
MFGLLSVNVLCARWRGVVLDDASRLASHIGGLLGAAGVAHGHRDVGAYQGFQGHLVRLLLAHDLDHAVGERGHVVAVLVLG